jgi:plasmid maintenance system killer protein
VETDEDRRFHLRAASAFHVRELLFDGVDRKDVLGKVRAKVPGFPEERYEQALDEARALVTTNRERALQRRSELIDAARKDDVLNSVFALRYFNERYSNQHVRQYNLGRVNIHETLRDLHSEADIDAALIRVDALINDAFKSVSYEPGAAEARMEELRRAHPGFNNRSLNAAMDWGYLVNR